MSTLSVPPVPTSPQQDATMLHKAFKGFGCDTAAVINILAHRDATQRNLIQHEYRNMYSEDIMKRLCKELSGKLETAVLLWMHDPARRDAVVLKQALTSESLNLHAATEVICSRTPSQLQMIRQIYQSTFGTYIEHDLERQASGHHKKLLIQFLGIVRYEGPEVDNSLAENDANALYRAGEKRLGTDEDIFIRVFSERSRPQLAAVSAAYRNMRGHSLEKAIKKETSGLFEYALLTILRCAENPALYFAKVLNKAMKGLGTDDTTLIRVIVTRTEMDMQFIKAEYKRKYKRTLHHAVRSDTSGHYKNFLLALLGPEQ